MRAGFLVGSLSGSTSGGTGSTLFNGQTFTVTGSGFGAKTQTAFARDKGTAPVGTLSSVWTNSNPDGSVVAADRIQNYDPAIAGATSTAIGLPHPGVTKYSSGCHGGNNANDGFDVAVTLGYTPPAYPYVVKMTWYERCDYALWQFTQQGSGEFNYKNFALSQGPGIYDGPKYLYFNFTPSGIGNNTTVSSGISTSGIANGFLGTERNGNGGSGGSFWGQMLSPFRQANGWVRKDVEIQVSGIGTTNGYILCADNYVTSPHPAIYANFTVDDAFVGNRSASIGGYSVMYPFPGANYRYFADMMIDVSGAGAVRSAQTYLSTSPIYNQSTAFGVPNVHTSGAVTIQQDLPGGPSSWTDNSIPCSAWMAEIPVGTTVYAHVVCQNGTVFQNVAPGPWMVVSAPSAFDFYISPTGNDGNPGTQVAPWSFASLLNPNQPNYTGQIAANRVLMAGKRIGVLPGTYSLQTIAGVVGLQPPGDFSTPQYQVPAGTGPSAVTVCQSTVRFGAILDGQWGTSITQNTNGVPLFGTAMSSASTKYVTIDGFEVKNGSGHLMMVGGDSAFTGAKVPGITVQNMYLHGTLDNSSGGNSAAITIYCCDGLVFKNNYATNIVNTNGRNTGVETWGCINAHMLNNTIVMNNAGASAMYTKNTNQFNIEYGYNVFDTSAAPSVAGSGTVAWDLDGTAANSSSLHHNLFLVNNGFNVGISGVSTTSINEAIISYNNTVVSAGSYVNGIHPAGSASAVIQHYNSVYVSANQNGSGNFCCSTCVPALTDYNLYKSFRNTTASTQCNSLVSWQAAVPVGCIGKDAHSVTATASFVGGTPTLPASAYQLTPGTTGSATGANPGSTNGQTSGAACDMGCWGNLGSVTQIGCDHSHPANV